MICERNLSSVSASGYLMANRWSALWSLKRIRQMMQTLSANTFVKNGLSMQLNCAARHWIHEWTMGRRKYWKKKSNVQVNRFARWTRWTEGILKLNSRSKWRAHLNILSLKMAETRKSVHGDPEGKIWMKSSPFVWMNYLIVESLIACFFKNF